jgi:hypothetical protein
LVNNACRFVLAMCFASVRSLHDALGDINDLVAPRALLESARISMRKCSIHAEPLTDALAHIERGYGNLFHGFLIHTESRDGGGITSARGVLVVSSGLVPSGSFSKMARLRPLLA